MNLSKNSNKLSKLLALLMALVMVFGSLPVMAFAEDEAEVLPNNSLVEELETVEEPETEVEAQVAEAQNNDGIALLADDNQASYLASIAFGFASNKLTTFDTSTGTRTFDFDYIASGNESSGYLTVTLSEAAPENSKILLVFTNRDGVIRDVLMTSGKRSILSSLVAQNMTGNTLEITVGVEGNEQSYKLNINRTLDVKITSLTDSDGNAMMEYEGNYLLPEASKSFNITANSYGADLTFNSQVAEDSKPFSITPVWSADDTFAVNVKVAYGGKSEEKSVTVKKLKTTDEFSGSCGDSATWKYVNGEMTISGTGAMADYTQGTTPWNAFLGGIKKVTVENGITSIGACSFSGANKLSEVSLPASLTSLKSYAFAGCTSLKTVSLPEGLTEISQAAFMESGLTEITIPASVKTIGLAAFSKCLSLKSATVNGMLGENIFGSCSALESVTFNGNDLKAIPRGAFNNCTSLKSFVIPEGVETIGAQSYGDKQAYFESVTIPNTLTGITASTFGNKLTDIILKSDNPNYVKIGKILYTKDMKTLVLCEKNAEGAINVEKGVETVNASAFLGITGITSVTFPDTVKTLGNDVFNGCNQLVSIKFSEGVETIGTNAFYNCNKLEEINLPSTLTSIGKMSFFRCYALKTIEIPEKVTVLPAVLFSNAKNIEKVILPAGLKKIDSNAFFLNEVLTTIYFRGDATAWNNITGAGKPAAGVYEIIYNYGRDDIAKVSTQPSDCFFIKNEDDATNALAVTVDIPQDVKVSFKWYTNPKKSTDGSVEVTSGFSVSADGKTSYCTPPIDTKSVNYYYCIVTSTLKDGSEVTDMTRIATVEVNEKVWEGKGTEDKPFLINTAEDLQKLYTYVAELNSVEGKYFKLTNDITLPEGWKPIGVTKDGTNNIQKGANLAAFTGIIDGDNHLITVPKGGLPLLGYIKGAEVKNLCIYGEQIDGYGLVNNFEGVGLDSSAIIIDNVTIESGSRILKSGLIGGNITTNAFAGNSNGFVATIKNCTIKEDVIVGYDGTQSLIGGFAGRMQGTIENCVNYGTVKGVNYVGGIIGTRDNAMGNCSVNNCKFYGTVEATGSYVGGIVGGGYTNYTAPNGIKMNVNGCVSEGKVSGVSNVGGIFGGDAFVVQAWNAYELSNNHFAGAVSGESRVGAIIGGYRSFNVYDNIHDNTFTLDCGTTKWLGAVDYVDTNYENPTPVEGTTYVNSEFELTGVESMSKTGLQRTDDPLGADADKLAKGIPSDKMLAAEVDELIDAIDMTAEDKAVKVAEARGKYEALTDAQKELVENLAKLEAYEQQLSDEEKAEAVEALIDAIGEVDKDSEGKIKAARDAYDKLTEDQKKLVSSDNLKKLEAAEVAYAKLLKENGPKTGDSMSIAWLALAFVAAAVTGTTVYKRKKKA